MERAEVISDLLRRASVTAPGLLAGDVAAALREAGAHRLALYVVDYEQETLQHVVLGSDLLAEAPKGVRVEGTMAGKAFQAQTVLTAATEDGWRVWVPVRERAERLGVLEVDFDELDDELLRLADDLGLLVGHLVRTAGRYTDEVELRRRRRPMNLAAEMQWDMLLPSLSFSSPELAIAGLLEPAYMVAGDAFDYSLNGDVLDFTILDAMGHGVNSTMASTLALGAFRFGRRRQLGLTVVAELVDDALIERFDGEEFVTGHVAQLDIATGVFRWVNAGHPSPLLVRGSRVVAELACEPSLPFGLGLRIEEVGEWQLQPGDKLLFYSDGAVEARPRGGEQFGLDRLRDSIEQYSGAGLVASEVLRRVARELRGHRGRELQDDATLVFLEWQPGR
ncbi:MAG TPA: PP2C family protein-serine/threonine phosphatase [Acidimicrobiales bacterium]|nr:PP2C family protein-serine/threonine phosphatase [Acidimicrobiales bacterium]